MLTMCRRAAAIVLVAVVMQGTMPPMAGAQQPPPPSSPDLFAESMRSTRTTRTPDAYDAGAVVVNVARPPFKVALCAVGVAAGTAVFALTLGSGYRAAAAAVSQGCGGKWIVSGDDLRPDTARDISADHQGG